MTRIPFDEMKSTIKQAFLNAGMPEEKAEVCAQIHTESSRDGRLFAWTEPGGAICRFILGKAGLT